MDVHVRAYTHARKHTRTRTYTHAGAHINNHAHAILPRVHLLYSILTSADACWDTAETMSLHQESAFGVVVREGKYRSMPLLSWNMPPEGSCVQRTGRLL